MRYSLKRILIDGYSIGVFSAGFVTFVFRIFRLRDV